METQDEFDEAFIGIVTDPENLALDALVDDEVLIHGTWHRREMPSGATRWVLTIELPTDCFADLVTARRLLDHGVSAPPIELTIRQYGLRLARIAATAFERECLP